MSNLPGRLLYITKNITLPYLDNNNTYHCDDYVDLKINDCLIYIETTYYSLNYQTINKYYTPRIGEFIYLTWAYTKYLEQYII